VSLKAFPLSGGLITGGGLYFCYLKKGASMLTAKQFFILLVFILFATGSLAFSVGYDLGYRHAAREREEWVREYNLDKYNLRGKL
jgi:ABC-type iron transport system FetAB permease component